MKTPGAPLAPMAPMAPLAPVALLALTLAIAYPPSPVSAENEVHRHTWSDHDASDPGLASGVVVESEKEWTALRVAAESAGGSSFPIARFSGVEISETQYALVGEVRHQNVDGAGYLEMWSIFADGSRYFSRTQAPAGLLQGFSGTSGWRAYALPFHLGDSPLRPEAIEINLVLPGRGVVELGPISLIEFAPGEDPLGESTESTDAWWSDRTGGLVGGIGGAMVGLVGALVGILAGLGRARGLVTALVVLVAAAGIASLVAAAVAFFGGQPYAVYYPLALGGGLSAAFGLGALRVLPRRYAAIELRRMDALDAR